MGGLLSEGPRTCLSAVRIIVFLLALLRMGIQETIEEFKTIWLTVFADAALDPAARSERLRCAIRDLMKQKDMVEDKKMHVEDEGVGCQVYVFTFIPFCLLALT